MIPGVVGQLMRATSPGLEFVDGTSATANASSVTVNKPSLAVDGDFLVFYVVLSNRTRVLAAPPSGLTLEVNDNSTQNRNALYSRVCSSEPSSYTFSTTGFSDNFCVLCLAYRGVSSIDVIGSFAGVAAASISAPSITIPGGGVLLALFGSEQGSGGDTVATPPAGFTARTSGARSNATCVSYEKSSPVAGATGTATLVWANAAQAKVGFQIHLA